MAGASDPIFAATPKAWSGLAPATLDVSLTAPTNITTLVTAGTNGTKIEQIRSIQVATTASACIVNLFTFDGTTYHFLDYFSHPLLTLTTTAQAAPIDKFFQNLVLQTAWSLRCTVTTAAGQAAFCVTAFGGDF